MKKTVALVGVSAMVLMLGLGSGFAQQNAPKETATGSAVTQVKPGTPGEAVKDKTVAPKTEFGVKPDKPIPLKGAGDQATDKTTVAKPAVEDKGDQNKPASKVKATAADPAKSVAEKTPETAADAKAPVKQ